MKRILFLLAVTFAFVATSVAQPAKSRTATAAKKTEATAKPQDRASLMFPTAASMPDDVVWQRDIYRQLDLMRDKNAPMYYPVEPKGRQVNLFTYLFRLILTGRVTAYTYKLDGNESFEEKDKMAVRDMLERYGIYFEEDNGRLTVSDSDVPSAEATRYYIKESVFFNQRTGTFTTKVTALCPILMRGADEFSTDATPYPLFWVKYDDVAPWLAKLPMMGSNLNNVSRQTADDFFTMNLYEGKIYKTNNLQGRVLANYCPTDSLLKKEQIKIEKQLADFEEGVWGHRRTPQDSARAAADSIAALQKVQTKKSRTSSTTVSTRSRRRTTTTTAASSAESSAEATPRVSARRTRR